MTEKPGCRCQGKNSGARLLGIFLVSGVCSQHRTEARSIDLYFIAEADRSVTTLRISSLSHPSGVVSVPG
jgi:hypothetical protein